MLKYYWFKILNKLKGSAVKNSTFGFDSKVESGTIFLNSSMGRYSFCGYNCFINNCEIGSFVSIADGVSIGRGRHPIEWVSTSPVFYDNRDSVITKFSRHKRKELQKTIIGNDVWIGDNVLIRAGVRIGDGSVIGMGSVVTRDVEPYAIVAGVPAKTIRYRFSQNIIEELQKTKWWDLSDKVLKDIANYIQQPERFIEEIKKMNIKNYEHEDKY